jgi:hypothetical protein
MRGRGRAPWRSRGGLSLGLAYRTDWFNATGVRAAGLHIEGFQSGRLAGHEWRLTVLVASPPFFLVALPLVTAPVMSTSSGCPPTTGYNTVPAVEDLPQHGGEETGRICPAASPPISRRHETRIDARVRPRGEQLAKNRLPLGPSQRHGIHPDPPVGFGDGPGGKGLEIGTLSVFFHGYTAAKSGCAGMRHGGGRG